MKIVSYNINGLRAFSKEKLQQFMDNFFDFDVICFQEIKINDCDEAASYIDNYNYGTAICTNDYKKGYAGVMNLLERNNIETVVSLGSNKKDIIYNDDPTYTSGRIVYTEFPSFYIVNVYTPNSGKKEDLRKNWDSQFVEFIKQLDKPVIICGDLNVCSTELDYWGKYDKAIDTAPGLMQFEIDGFQNLCKECDLIDAFRYMHPDERSYSWYSTRNVKSVEKNQGWRLDYFLVSSSLKDKIKSCKVCQGYQAPDHSPITLEIEM